MREANLSAQDVLTIHAQLRFLADRCDGAMAQDGAGYNKLDANFGRELAAYSALTPRMALAARKMLVKYTKQLSRMSN